jgi:hypothetical protein
MTVIALTNLSVNDNQHSLVTGSGRPRVFSYAGVGNLGKIYQNFKAGKHLSVKNM